MARIVIRNLGKSFESSDFSKSLLALIHEQGIDWMHACGGKGRCTTCKAIVLEGESMLTEYTTAEVRYQKQGLLRSGERLACQVKIKGDIVVEVPDTGKFPHMTYLPQAG
ncbi:MAG TPA: 2Fe-2S iron-sulfur cluster-binding protein [Cyclobacteriaceae bacterium]|nr:2Fe-2S iron-sulfur cluster-binding protein [Cyclobacteriaceae bacterium]HRJ82615.1 2Fe-2S iron-sulfur cluster-binding protein [Cyclobacteriaceae bacterium]